jgi:hypothetical protein
MRNRIGNANVDKSTSHNAPCASFNTKIIFVKIDELDPQDILVIDIDVCILWYLSYNIATITKEGGL